VPGSRIVHLEGASTGISAGRRKRLPAYLFQARRRFFLKNHGPHVTALADAAFLAGLAVWRVRRRVQGKPDTDPEHILGDALRHSVFATGFAVTEVENPALASSPLEQQPRSEPFT
jgi:cobalamin biosynthesis protein CbiG